MRSPRDTDYTGTDTNPMHIVTTDEYDRHVAGEIVTMTALCGLSLTYGEGAEDSDPLCPECYTAAGWTYDRRTPCPSGYTTDLVATTTMG